jgi:hypothetical protein
MIDLRGTIAPKSDQLNADDLIGSSMVITITGVKLCSEADQPVAINFEGDNGKSFRPCKSMRRVLVNLWGPDAKTYTGRKLKLYRDDKVLFGGVAVGGIRISHASGIDKPVTMALTVTRANRKPFTVQPLQSVPENPRAADIDGAANIAALKGTDVLRAFWDGLDASQKRALQPRLQNLKEIAAKNDFASDPDTRAPLGGGKRAPASPESLAGTRGIPTHPRDAGASGTAGRAPAEPSKSPGAPPSFDDASGLDEEPAGDALQAAYDRGQADRRSGKSVRAVPQEYRTPECKAEADEWRVGWNDEDQERKAA